MEAPCRDLEELYAGGREDKHPSARSCIEAVPGLVAARTVDALSSFAGNLDQEKFSAVVRLL